MSAEIIIMRTRERIDRDTERLQLMRDEQARIRASQSEEVQQRSRDLAEAIAFYHRCEINRNRRKP